MRREIHSFVIRKGKMSQGQKNAYKNWVDKWSIPCRQETWNPRKAFPGKKIFLEIGFGMGDATWQIAKDNPENIYIGLEVHKPGIGKLLSYIENEGLENLFIIEKDAMDVVEYMLPPKSVDGVHIFFPDPWPKKKHHKRRLIQEPFISQVLDRIRPEGYLYVVTDWKPYAEVILQVLEANGKAANAYKGYAEAQPWRPQTAFERKGLEKNHNVFEFYYNKL